MSRKKAEAAQETNPTEVEVVAITFQEPKETRSSEKAEQDLPTTPAPHGGSNHQPGQPGSEREYPPEPNPRPWAHNKVAGVQLLTHRDPYEAALAFAEKPPQEVIDCMKENGFRWNGQGKVWTRAVNFETQAQDRLVASRTYHKVVGMLLQAKGATPESEGVAPF
jgi:hypothetical protein